MHYGEATAAIRYLRWGMPSAGVDCHTRALIWDQRAGTSHMTLEDLEVWEPGIKQRNGQAGQAGAVNVVGDKYKDIDMSLGLSTVLRALAGYQYDGMRVVLFGRNKQSLQQVVEEHDERECIVVGDINNAVDRQRLIQAAVVSFGHIDVFVPAAGIVSFAGVEQVTEQVLLHHLRTNFISIVELTNLVVPHIPMGGSAGTPQS